MNFPSKSHAAPRRETLVYDAYKTICERITVYEPSSREFRYAKTRIGRVGAAGEYRRAPWGRPDMTVGVCLVRAGLPAPDALGGLLRRCGLTVWTPAVPDADDGRIYGGALCIIIDMPGDAGFRTLKLFRDYGVETSILLIVDPGLEKATTGAERQWRIDVVSRDVEPREILRRIEALVMKHHDDASPRRRRA